MRPLTASPARTACGVKRNFTLAFPQQGFRFSRRSCPTWLNPIDAPYKSLSEISRVYNVPRATLSKALVILRDAVAAQSAAVNLSVAEKLIPTLKSLQSQPGAMLQPKPEEILML